MTTPGRPAALALVFLLLAGCAVKQPVPIGDFTEPVAQTAWKGGDEWAYPYGGASGAGTFAWRVDRKENLAGVPHYVVTAGPREIFYRVDDLGSPGGTWAGRICRGVTRAPR